MSNIYQEIDGSHTFVKKVIQEHYENIAEKDKENFDKIRVYNTIEEPLFNGIDVYYCLKDTKKKVERMYDDLLDDEILKQQKVSGVSRPINLITEYGVIHACYLYKNDIALIFQKFMREVIKQLKTKGVATVIEAHNQLAKNLEEERTRRREAEEINIQNIFLRDAYCNDFSNSDDNETELAILRRQYLTTYYIYLVDWQYVNTKYWKKNNTNKNVESTPRKKIDNELSNPIAGINLNSDSDDTGEDEQKTKVVRSRKPKNDITEPHPDGINDSYELEYIKLNDLEYSENDEYYFYISHKELSQNSRTFKLITTIQLDKVKHCNEMINYIINGEPNIDRTAYTVNSYEPTEIADIETDYKVKTPIRGVYKTSYSNLISARNRSFIVLNKEIIIGNMKKRR